MLARNIYVTEYSAWMYKMISVKCLWWPDIFPCL